MTTTDVRAWFAELDTVFEREREHLAELDEEIGDGDHGASMARGFSKAQEALASSSGPPGALLAAAGAAFMKGAGGASGPLFATLFLELGKAASASGTLDLTAIRHGMRNALARIQRLGHSHVGDKTLLDALAPAADTLDEAGERAASLEEALAQAAEAAAAGAASTAQMPARQGRARFIERQGVGRTDPGATSMALVVRTLSDVARRRGE